MARESDDALHLVLCVLLATAICYGGAAWCREHPIPLWEKYGPWLEEHPTRAVAAVTAVLYLFSRRLGQGELAGGDAPQTA